MSKTGLGATTPIDMNAGEDDDDYRTCLDNGTRCMRVHDYPSALIWFERAQARAPAQGVDALRCMGAAKVLMGNANAALWDLDQALAVDPTNAETMSWKSRALAAFGLIHEAEEWSERAATQAPRDHVILRQRGIVRMQCEKAARAVEDFAAADAACPENPETTLWLARALLGRALSVDSLGDLVSARSVVRRLVEQMCPSALEPLLLWAHIETEIQKRGGSPGACVALYLQAMLVVTATFSTSTRIESRCLMYKHVANHAKTYLEAACYRQFSVSCVNIAKLTPDQARCAYKHSNNVCASSDDEAQSSSSSSA